MDFYDQVSLLFIVAGNLMFLENTAIYSIPESKAIYKPDNQAIMVILVRPFTNITITK